MHSSTSRAGRVGLSVVALLLLAAARPAIAQTTYGPGLGGSLVDGTNTTIGTFTSVINVSAPGQTIASLNSVSITGFTHTWVGDLVITLTHVPSGTSQVLSSPPDDNSANLNGNYSFVVNPALQTLDEASSGRASTFNIPVGSYAISTYGGGVANGPRANFNVFNGLALTGAWRLTIEDFAAGDTGAISGWSFNATSATTSVAPESGSFLLLALGGVGIAARRRTRR